MGTKYSCANVGNLFVKPKLQGLAFSYSAVAKTSNTKTSDPPYATLYVTFTRPASTLPTCTHSCVPGALSLLRHKPCTKWKLRLNYPKGNSKGAASIHSPSVRTHNTWLFFTVKLWDKWSRRRRVGTAAQGPRFPHTTATDVKK
jgi:hypothetical protein